MTRPRPRDTDAQGRQVVAAHPKARFQYEILDTVEAGLVLQGTEVKALRQGKAQLQEAYARFREDAIWLIKCHIPEYSQGNVQNHEPTRPRKLLLHRAELRRLHTKVKEKGLTLVPLTLYFNADGRAKLELALARGKNLFDKRETVRKREADREIRRANRR